MAEDIDIDYSRAQISQADYMSQLTGNIGGQHGKGFRMTRSRKLAAAMYANGSMTYAEIAQRMGIKVTTLSNWISAPEFKAYVAEIDRHRIERLKRLGIASKQRRIEEANDRHERCKAVIEARAADPSMAHVPGGPTGIMVREYKSGDRGRVLMEEYKVDTGLLREMRELEKQVGLEVGDFQEKLEPLSEGQQNEYHLTVEDRRTFILQIFSALGHPISPESLDGLADLGRPSLPAPRTGDGESGNDPGPVAGGSDPVQQ